MRRSGRPEVCTGPPAGLLRLHRHSRVSIVVLGGTSAGRAEIARAFHRASPLATRPFLALDCGEDEQALRRALQRWLAPADVQEGAELLPGLDGGMLFLDRGDCLLDSSQRLLLMLARRLQDEMWQVPSGRPGPARLAVGSQKDLAGLEERGFSRELIDCLDKIRVELRCARRDRLAGRDRAVPRHAWSTCDG